MLPSVVGLGSLSDKARQSEPLFLKAANLEGAKTRAMDLSAVYGR